MRGWEDVKMSRCEDEKMWRWEDVKMRRCEDVKMRRCEDEKMWRWEDVKWEDVKMRRCEDEKMWRWEDEIQTPTIGRTLRSDALGKNLETTRQPEFSSHSLPGWRKFGRRRLVSAVAKTWPPNWWPEAPNKVTRWTIWCHASNRKSPEAVRNRKAPSWGHLAVA